jgi:hypothetical protein
VESIEKEQRVETENNDPDQTIGTRDLNLGKHPFQKN